MSMSLRQTRMADNSGMDNTEPVLVDENNRDEQLNLLDATGEEADDSFEINQDAVKQMAKVTEGVFLSGEFVARQLAFLQQHKIMHIVNVATSEAIPNFHPDKFKYFNIEITDYEKEDIGKHFDSATKFIRNAIEKHENVLVHCRYGNSRSASIVLAYLIRYEQLSLVQALKKVRRVRPTIEPNEGFLEQLKTFEKKQHRH